jgi:flavin reductase (DIM6/NTAB) family NADH-FMN oxidoreductase RutF
VEHHIELKPIDIKKFTVQAYGLFEEQWMLLTSGDFAIRQYNTMTISWGALGVMWNRPFAQVVVRPVRHTYQFMEAYETFTLTAFPRQYHKALSLLGTRSGRDGDKIADAGLTPTASSAVAAPCFAEAELVIECQKIYWQDFNPVHFLDPEINRNYPARDFHRIYYGEIVAVRGVDRFTSGE